jgi:hypothetical protein
VCAHRARLPWTHARLEALAERRAQPLRIPSLACGPERILREWVGAGNAARVVLRERVRVLGPLDDLPDATIAPFLDGLARLLDDGAELLLTNVHEANPWRARPAR